MNFFKLMFFCLVLVHCLWANSLVRDSNQVINSQQSEPLKLSATDLMFLQLLLNNQNFKDSFVEECANEAGDILGKNQANMSCQCAYDKLVKNDSLLYLLMGGVDENGEVDFEKWGYSLISPCLPEKFTDEMEKAFIAECEGEKKEVSQKTCSCAFDEIKRNYTVQSFLKEFFLQKEFFAKKMFDIVSKCVAP